MVESLSLCLWLSDEWSAFDDVAKITTIMMMTIIVMRKIIMMLAIF